jgi:hypothetical protein
MPNTLVINSISGTSPYDIYVCDATITYCFFVSTITSAPYTFDIPFPLDATTPIILKIVDGNNCERIYTLSCEQLYGKQFEDFAVFLFQDAAIYVFEGP